MKRMAGSACAWSMIPVALALVVGEVAEAEHQVRGGGGDQGLDRGDGREAPRGADVALGVDREVRAAARRRGLEGVIGAAPDGVVIEGARLEAREAGLPEGAGRR